MSENWKLVREFGILARPKTSQIAKSLVLYPGPSNIRTIVATSTAKYTFIRITVACSDGIKNEALVGESVKRNLKDRMTKAD